jgi:cytochrome c peroxidase
MVQPRGVVYRRKTDTLLVAAEGTDTLVEVDARSPEPGLMWRDGHELGEEKDIPLAINEKCAAPAGVALSADEDTAYVFCRASYDLVSFPLGKGASATLRLATDPLGEKVAKGRRMFYGVGDVGTSGGLGCAGCHPEGRDDGHAWTLQTDPIRTQSVAGGISQTAPFHWKGELRDMKSVMGVTFVSRMGGLMPDDSAVTELQKWVDGVPLPKVDAVAQPDVVGHGAALFAERCQSCHAGPMLTASKNFDVGTGSSFQVPTLRGVALRGPFMHNGCATTLKDRFGACGGGAKHGNTADLAPVEIDALVAYLDTL